MSVGDFPVAQAGTADEAGASEASEAQVIATDLDHDQISRPW